MSVFDPVFDELPSILPIFPLTGALILPHTALPLNIFEPRYLNMVSDALRRDRMIGMIQPKPVATNTSSVNIPMPEKGFAEGYEERPEGVPKGGSSETGSSDAIESDQTPFEPEPVYTIGCAGRIIRFEESDDGRFVITLKGVARFKLADELPIKDGFRRIRPDWSDYEHDLTEDTQDIVQKERLLTLLQPYFTQRGIEADFDSVAQTPVERLTNSLAMICPFEPSEKQALLEAKTVIQRVEVLTSLIEMAVLETSHEDHVKQ